MTTASERIRKYRDHGEEIAAALEVSAENRNLSDAWGEKGDRSYDVESPHLTIVTPPVNVTRTMEGRIAVYTLDGPTLVLSGAHARDLIEKLQRALGAAV